MSISRNVRLLAWFNFLSDFRPYNVVAILYFSEVAGSFALGMSVFSAVFLAGALFEVPTGILSDMIGRRRTLICGAGASVLSIVCYALAWEAGFALLIVGAALEGLARAFFSGNNDALLYDTLADAGREAEFGDLLGRTGAMFQAALAASAIIGSVVAFVSLPAAIWLSVIPQVMGFALTFAFAEPRRHTRESTNVFAHLREAFDAVMRNRRLRTLTAAGVMRFALGESGYLFRNAFIEMLWPRWALGLVAVVSNGAAAFSFYIAGRAIRRFGELRLITIAKVYSHTVNLIGLLMANTLTPALMASTSIFFGIVSVAQGGLMQHEFTDEQRATMGSLTAFAGNIVFAVVSVLIGALADAIGPLPTLIIAEVVSVFVVFIYRRALRPTPLPQPSPAG